MPDTRYPGAQQFDGAHADYSAGRIRNLTTNLAHFTVGRNSIGTCGRDFQILADRDGTLHQGAPVDAVCWGAGDPWNSLALHIEVEYLPGVDDTIFTPAARQSVSGLLHWMWTEWGVPLDYYDGPRIRQWNGTISHRSLIQTGDLHNDWWPQDDWDAMVAGPTPPPLKEPAMDYILSRTDDGMHTLCTALGETPDLFPAFATSLIDGGMPQVKLDGVACADLLAKRMAQRAAFVGSIPPGGGAPAPLPTKGTWTIP